MLCRDFVDDDDSRTESTAVVQLRVMSSISVEVSAMTGGGILSFDADCTYSCFVERDSFKEKASFLSRF